MFKNIHTYPLLLEFNKTKDENTQVKIHTKRHMNNAWSEMVSWSPRFSFYCFFFVHINNMGLLLSWTNVVALF